MLKKLLLYLPCTFALAQCDAPQTTTPNMEFKQIPVTYPFSKRDTAVTDSYFGITVKDPYRWLEDDLSEDTKKWVIEQNKATYASTSTTVGAIINFSINFSILGVKSFVNTKC